MNKKNNNKLQLIPLGGIGEIGKNMFVLKYNDEIIIIDSGLTFPGEEMLGIDIVIPDITYLIENKECIKAIILTHGHEDHIGALPYILKDINAPIYGTKLTLGLAENKLKEHGLNSKTKLNIVQPGNEIVMGKFIVEFIKVNHSIPDTAGLAIKTPIGTIVHTGDFKIDQTPVDNQMTDIHKFAELGDKGVLLMLSDSTNSEREGYTMSERVVGNTINDIFRTTNGRILVATFASNVHRIQQIFDAANKYNRKVAVIGRSMINVVNKAIELGYLNMPDDLMLELQDINKLPLNKTVIITTGSQGEPMSALARMSMSEHKKVNIVPGDTVLIAATPIPGNEKTVGKTIDHLFKLGANVIYESISGVHVSGHASQEELKLMLNLVKPKYFLPVHGEYRHIVRHAQLAKEVGIPEENIFITDNGNILELTTKNAKTVGKVTSGKVLVDGLGVGDVGNIVLRDRKQLSQDGIIIVVVTLDKEKSEIVAGPDIVSRGFVYVRESEELIESSKERVKQAIVKCQEMNISDWASIKTNVRESLNTFLYEKIKRRPMILPIIMEINNRNLNRPN